ncbi:hypothetical protein Sango_0764900 [Sesamum angolense]|uniref:F-box associated beta-propeller type 1 domain-containing protein n=1 Tax=Sesamum angolense TaxID=2727404 RepID=A0AAE1X2Y1_9LAMI|nr:hypothetical protein Sango_0764900 [Sesamum angolense]
MHMRSKEMSETRSIMLINCLLFLGKTADDILYLDTHALSFHDLYRPTLSPILPDVFVPLGNMYTPKFVGHLDLDSSYEEDRYIMTNVYDASIDSCRIIDTKLPDLDHKPEFNLFFNGAQHWKVTAHDWYEQNANHDDVGYKILCFDMSSEVFKWISYPRTYYHEDDRKCEALVSLKQCFAIVQYGFESVDCIEIWVMKEYGLSESWTKKFVIDPNSKNFDLVPKCCSWQDEWIVLKSTGN